MNIAFVLVSYRGDAPAGMERSVAALRAGLRGLGHGAVVLSAEPAAEREPGVVRLHSLGMTFPCDDVALRASVVGNRRLAAEVESTVARFRIDVVCYIDALWGLGRLLPIGRARQVLMVHVIGHAEDLRTALDHRPDAVIVPSPAVLTEALRCGYDIGRWEVVPNGLLVAAPIVPDAAARARLRTDGPVRVTARLGAEKGIVDLLATAPRQSRHTEIAVTEAAFEADPGSQAALMSHCRALASGRGWLRLRGGLAWCEVPGFLAGAAAVLVPSHTETFGLVALESMSVGTPVVARRVGNLPDLIGPAGALVPADAGDQALWSAVNRLIADEERYAQASRAGIERARGYRPLDVATRWMKAATSR